MVGRINLFDRALLQRRRARGCRMTAPGTAQPDFLLQRAADDIEERLAFIRRPFPVAACVGAGCGLIANRLRASGRHDLVVDVEPSPAQATQPATATAMQVAADEEALPLASEAFDLVVSALALHVVNDLPGALIQIRRALKPDGLLLATFLGGDTLAELRQAMLEAETETTAGAAPRVHPVGDLVSLGGLLTRAGFSLPVVDTERVVATYAHPLALMHDLRAMGATNVLTERTRRPLRRDTLSRACEIYAARFAAPNGRVRATFEFVTLTAWTPHESQQKPLKPGSATARLADALGTRTAKRTDNA